LARDPYEILEVQRGCDQQTAHKAFRRLAKKWHPDAHSGDARKVAERKFKEIKEAYDQIKSGEPAAPRRERESASGPGGWSSGFAWSEAAPPRRGADLRREIAISLRQAYSGCSAAIADEDGFCARCHGKGRNDADPPVTCSLCRGAGAFDQEDGILAIRIRCEECAGTGRVRTCSGCGGSGRNSASRLQVAVPAGCADGTTLRLPRMGAPGQGGAQPGDMLVTVRVVMPPSVTVSGPTVTHRMEIPAWDAALGCYRTLDNVDGKTLKVSIPPGTQPGQRFRLPGRGMPTRDGRGDLIVQVAVTIPSSGSEESAAAWRRLRDSLAA
jgi:molecular chaperone DnaJ